SSRRLDVDAGGHTVGVLVQSNYGGRLTIAGVPVGDALPDPDAYVARTGTEAPPSSGDGSIMIVVATDAPLDDRQLRRLGQRALRGLGRTGASMSNGSGDSVVAFSTAAAARRPQSVPSHTLALLPNGLMTPLFEAVAEATEEAIVNSMFRATTVSGHRGTIPA